MNLFALSRALIFCIGLGLSWAAASPSALENSPGPSGSDAQRSGGGTRLAQSAAVTVSPRSVNAGSTATLKLTANGTVDLSTVSASEIGVRPADGFTDIQIVSQSAQRLTFSVNVAASVAKGGRTLTISNAAGVEIVALDLQVVVPRNVCFPDCVGPAACIDNQCVSPQPDPCESNPCHQGQKCCSDTPVQGMTICVKPTDKCPNPH